ncbi:ABC transporter related protein [Sulfobacillus acidophilus TPY]|uniref:Monosaccharide ABC transporter ATP-binding protein, CUT2 family n=1 Tax=Sulfobacillus acidophilus (strain ATCC 700253 / DSM 10332 / NAL) TaxID=679936 RepID=G8TSY6_SULAD|nr:ABC transporter related protein [Sulfobacillus acidophilus TPY]AEW05601.1 monosaccharide ABC transporter ATP-binding protein, CUT2 family [Sulfobacillus acidophilus DSM 10332]
MSQTASVTPIMEARGIRKSFGPVEALRNVSLRLYPGEVLGLVGNNGAGKSTLIKILTGFHAPDGGEIFLNGEPVHFRSPDDARAHGIETVYQDLGLVNDLPVYRNMFLRREHVRKLLGFFPLLDDRRMQHETREYLKSLKLELPSVTTDVGYLSGGQRQAIAVARSLFMHPKVLILDEPLAAMGAREGRMILDLVVDLKTRFNTAILLIAHNYAQVFEVCDRINWLSRGEISFDRRVDETSVDELTRLVMADYRDSATGTGY